jgi:hypothetical protein
MISNLATTVVHVSRIGPNNIPNGSRSQIEIKIQYGATRCVLLQSQDTIWPHLAWLARRRRCTMCIVVFADVRALYDDRKFHVLFFLG